MKHIRLNNIEHKDLRVATKHSPMYGDNVHFGLLVPGELKMSQNFYPIFIQKDSSTGKFFLAALFGFQEGENLFLDDNGWNSEYIPISIQRQPFLIGQETIVENGVQKVNRVIHLDMDSRRIYDPQGERLFNEDGQNTEYLNRIADMLEFLHHGLLETDQFIDRLLAYNLLESVAVKVTFNEYKHYELQDIYSINEKALAELSNENILSLFKDGYLEKIYSILHSQPLVSTLIRLKSLQDAL